jgi:hypothetical protein
MALKFSLWSIVPAGEVLRGFSVVMFKHSGFQGLFIQFWQQNMVSAGGETRSISYKTMRWQNNMEYCH